MLNLLIIGEGLKVLTAPLKAWGITMSTFKTVASATRKLHTADAILIQHDLKGLNPSAFRAVRHIPKVVITLGGKAARAKGQWVREPLTYIMEAPRGTELRQFVARVVRESAQILKAEVLGREIVDLRDELKYFEQMNHVLATSKNINDILVTIMKRAAKLTGAESWAVHLADEVSPLFVCSKATGVAARMANTVCSKNSRSIANLVAATGKPLLIKNASKDARLKKLGIYAACKCKPRTVIATSIKSEGRTLGVLEAINTRDGEPFDREDLAVLARLAEQASIAVERVSMQQRLEDLVVTDDLTSLFNTRYLNRSIEIEISRCQRYGTSVSLIFMDVDHFKDINDNFGHLVGSRVLVEVGQILIRELRNIDVVSRYGGDEFVMILPHTTLGNAMLIAERIRKAIERTSFINSEGLDLRLTASFGVAAYPESAKNQEELVKLADQSMYKVKNRTRNGVYAII